MTTRYLVLQTTMRLNGEPINAIETSWVGTHLTQEAAEDQARQLLTRQTACAYSLSQPSPLVGVAVIRWDAKVRADYDLPTGNAALRLCAGGVPKESAVVSWARDYCA